MIIPENVNLKPECTIKFTLCCQIVLINKFIIYRNYKFLKYNTNDSI